MRVLLVSANREHIPDPIFPLGLAYVAAAIRQAGYQVAVADLCFGKHPLADLGRQVALYQPDIVGVSLRNVDNAAYPRTVDYLQQHREVVDTLRARTDAAVVLGGSGFSIMPREYMAVLNGDWGIAGEGERTFVTLIDALARGVDPGTIPGVIAPNPECGKHNRSVGIQPNPPARPADWFEGCRPARDLFDYPRYIRRGGMGNVQTKRGCVFKCSYCTYPLLEGNRIRARSAADIVDEIEALLQEYAGTVFLVSHDRAFLDNVVTQTIAPEGGGHWREYVGGYDDWKRQRSIPATVPEPARATRKTRAGKATPRGKTSATKLSYRESRELAELPHKIETLEAEQKSIMTRFEDPSFFSAAPDEAARLSKRIGEIESELLALIERWETLESRKS